MLFANRDVEKMLGAGGTAFRANTNNWDRTVRHGISFIFIPGDCTPEGKNPCGFPKSMVRALEKK